MSTRTVMLSDMPLCHMCGQRVATTPSAVVIGDDPDDMLRQLLKRRFVPHTDERGRRCSGSGQTLAVARGREGDNA